MRRVARAPIRAAVSAFQTARRAVWFFTRPLTLGAHAVPLTESGAIVLVRTSYARGWRLPGGGLKRGEEPEAAILRELREEIGLTRHGSVEWIGELRHEPDFRRGVAQVYVIRGVAYSPPAWSIEIEEVREFAPAALPPDLPPVTAAQLRMAGLLPEP
jgi:8-oxo-dGTP pyrophosphatase MutT (NUDIX family)